MTEKIETLRDNAAFRWIALLLLALAMFCSYIFMDILSPIKDLMQSTRGWDSSAFGTMQGAETFLNVFIFEVCIKTDCYNYLKYTCLFSIETC